MEKNTGRCGFIAPLRLLAHRSSIPQAVVFQICSSWFRSASQIRTDSRISQSHYHASEWTSRSRWLHAVDTHGPLDGLTADEALIIRFGRELLESPQVSDDTFNAVRARYGEKGLLELTAVMSVYTMNATILRVMDHQAAADARHLTPR